LANAWKYLDISGKIMLTIGAYTKRIINLFFNRLTKSVSYYLIDSGFKQELKFEVIKIAGN